MNRLELVKKIPIIDYAKWIGFTPIRIGTYYTLKEHDSVRIDPNKNMFIQNSTGHGGSVIDFAMLFRNIDFKEAFKELSKYIISYEPKNLKVKVDDKKEKPDKKKSFVLPKKDTSFKNVFAYLIKTRGIDSEIVKDFVENGFLYQDKNKNCVFVSYENGIPIFASKRGTNTYKRYVGDVAGSNYSHSFYIDNQKEVLIITESVIDAMSIMSIIKMGKKDDYKNFDYLALSGALKYEASLEKHLNNKEYKDIILCLDNDDSGINASHKINTYIKDTLGMNKINVFHSIPKEKDYNEYLVSLKKSEEILKESVAIYNEKSNPFGEALKAVWDKDINYLKEKIEKSFPYITEKDAKIMTKGIVTTFSDFKDLEDIWKNVINDDIFYEKNNWQIAKGEGNIDFEISYKKEKIITIFDTGAVDIENNFSLGEYKKVVMDILNGENLAFETFAENKIINEKSFLINLDKGEEI